MYPIMLHVHSLMRYVVIVLLVAAVLRSLVGLLGKKDFTTLDDKLGLYLMMAAHIQLLFGFVMYFISPTVAHGLSDVGIAMKEPSIRFWIVEHPAIMILAVIFITLGRVISKRASTDKIKFKRSLVFYGIGLILVLYGIPWLTRPFF